MPIPEIITVPPPNRTRNQQVDSNPREQKSPRTGNHETASAASTAAPPLQQDRQRRQQPRLTDKTMLNTLLRSHLQLRQDVTDLKTAITYVYIIEDITVKEKMYSAGEQWAAEAKSAGQGSNKIHPWACGKRTAAFIGMLRATIPKMVTDNEALRIANTLVDLEPAVIEKHIASFKPKHKTYRNDRHWVWELNLRINEHGEGAEEQIRKMVGLTTNKIIKIQPARPRQTADEETLWAYYKTLNRN